VGTGADGYSNVDWPATIPANGELNLDARDARPGNRCIMRKELFPIRGRRASIASDALLRSSRMNHSIPTHASADRERRSALGQFLTPSPVANLMASFFDAKGDEINLLDAGSGEGALTLAFVRELISRSEKPRRVSVTAYELDAALMSPLHATLSECAQECSAAGIEFSFTVINADFVSAAADMVRTDLYSTPHAQFNAAIVNPPYKKIRSDSATRQLLRDAGIETVNLYAGFIALITKLLTTSGELVAITPRSYCNGPYFKPFRSEFLAMMALRRLHLFESRDAAFREDRVLQENVIVHAVRGVPKQDRVVISTSTGGPDDPPVDRAIPYNRVIVPGDQDQFIHLPIDAGHDSAGISMGKLEYCLGDLNLEVSTGRVVDFRAKQYLRLKPDGDSAPLIYPCHFNGGFVHWPNEDTKKPNAIQVTDETRELLIPAGIYVLVKRFSAKEERRRIVACVYDPDRIAAPLVGFENHLNYFHFRGAGMEIGLAKGLAAFLNSTVVDAYFRQFSGHTQVNATDLRKLPYPSRRVLETIGNSLRDLDPLQEDIDQLLAEKFA
jgi:adenine-specific DNA-methyltransferase